MLCHLAIEFCQLKPPVTQRLAQSFACPLLCAFGAVMELMLCGRHGAQTAPERSDIKITADTPNSPANTTSPKKIGTKPSSRNPSVFVRRSQDSNSAPSPRSLAAMLGVQVSFDPYGELKIKHVPE